LKLRKPKPTFRKDKGIAIVKQFLWSAFIPEPQGGFWDQYGIDGHINGQTCQVKFDRRIATSGNIWHEIYEKTAHRPSQPWRRADGKVTCYIFVTETETDYVGYLITVNCLAESELGLAMRVIKPNDGEPTSMGFLLPLSSLTTEIKMAARVSRLDLLGHNVYESRGKHPHGTPAQA